MLLSFHPLLQRPISSMLRCTSRLQRAHMETLLDRQVFLQRLRSFVAKVSSFLLDFNAAGNSIHSPSDMLRVSTQFRPYCGGNLKPFVVPVRVLSDRGTPWATALSEHYILFIWPTDILALTSSRLIFHRSHQSSSELIKGSSCT